MNCRALRTPWVLYLVCVWAVLTGIARAEHEAVQASNSPAVAVALGVKGGVVDVLQVSEGTITRLKQASLSDNIKSWVERGKLAKPTIQRSTIRNESILPLELSQVRVMRVNGTEVTEAELTKELATPKPIVLLRAGASLEPIFAELFRPEALVIVSDPAEDPPFLLGDE